MGHIALGVIIFIDVVAELRIIFLRTKERLLVGCQDQQGIHLKFLKEMGCLFVSVENSKVGFLQ